MKLSAFLLLFIINLEVFSQDIPNYEDFSEKKTGYVVKTSGDTIKGEVQILETYPAVYLIPFKQDEIKIIISGTSGNNNKIYLKDLKFVKYGQDFYKIFTLKEFPYGSFMARIVDTPKIVNIYKAYEFIVINTVESLATMQSSSYFRIKELYLIQIGNLQPELFYANNYKEYLFTIQDINLKKFKPEIIENAYKVNYKKQLKNMFYYKKEVSKYIKKLKDVNYKRLPEIVDEINKMYK